MDRILNRSKLVLLQRERKPEAQLDLERNQWYIRVVQMWFKGQDQGPVIQLSYNPPPPPKKKKTHKQKTNLVDGVMYLLTV